MQVISAQTVDGNPVPQDIFERDMIDLKAKFELSCLNDPMFEIFGGVITLPNGNKYQVCG